MSVKYTLQEKGNPQNPAAPKKWYAIAKNTGEVTLKRLSREIAESYTNVTDTEVLVVLNVLAKALNRHLANGEIVRLGDFGSFKISMGSAGAEAPEKFNPSMIRNPKVIFRPGIDLKEMLQNLNFEKW